MKTKTVLTAVLGAVVGLGLAMGTMVWAQNTDHMGNIQTTQQTNSNQNIHGSMHGETAYKGKSRSLGQGMMGQTSQKNISDNMHQQAPVTTHHAGYKLPVPAQNTLCHEDTTVKSDAKT